MPEQVTSVGPGREAGETGDRAALVQKIARQQEEILRLRDLLIGRDAELGVARGRLAELEEHSGRLAVTAARLQARIPSIARVAAAPLRGLRGRRG